ncbi:MAG: 4Fe-4S binding protein [Desulfurivibrio sp.]|jgi:polyferredoxin|nr:MAG: 4Fe-4S binding protein [Desulfurivibrio sp.]
MKEKRSRRITQWIMAPLVPLVIVGGYFWPYLGYVALAMMLLMFILTLFRGRFYCGWICAMGAFHERVLALVSRKRNMLPVFKAKWFRWLLFILMMGILAMRLISAEGDPAKIGAAFVMMWTLSTGLAIFIGFFWQPRSWCAICPMATFQGVIAPCNYLLQVAPSCKGCGICRKSCPIETNPGSFKAQGFVTSGDCMRCGNCVVNCPVKALEFQTSGQAKGCSVLGSLGLK